MLVFVYDLCFRVSYVVIYMHMFAPMSHTVYLRPSIFLCVTVAACAAGLVCTTGSIRSCRGRLLWTMSSRSRCVWLWLWLCVCVCVCVCVCDYVCKYGVHYTLHSVCCIGSICCIFTHTCTFTHVHVYTHRCVCTWRNWRRSGWRLTWTIRSILWTNISLQ